MTQHTPGPWETWREDYRSDGLVLRQQRESGTGKYLYRLVEQPGIHEAEANARLIAAAPDLLAALRNSLWAMEDWELLGSNSRAAFVEQARAAIAKAEGN